jgi:hypothetical protein
MKSALKPQESKMTLDLLDAEHVEFIVDNTGKVWVNVDGKCVVRIGHAEDVTISRPDPPEHSVSVLPLARRSPLTE